MRGGFILGDGSWLPNNISLEGARVILAAAFRNDVPTFFAGLVAGVPSPSMTMLTMTEPAIGTNGYARVSIPRNSAGWPVQGESGGERFIESDWLVFAASGGNFTVPIRRIALLTSNTYSSSEAVFALSEPLPADLTITPATLLADRRFKYRIYL